MNQNLISTGVALTGAVPVAPMHGRQSRQRLLIASLVTLGLMFLPRIAGFFFGPTVEITLYNCIQVLLYPLRMFLTFVHESGHAIASIFTGNQVASLQLMTNGEGVTMSSQTFLTGWIINSAGYLGTTVFGAMMLQVGRLRKLRSPGRSALYFASGAILLITLLWGWHDLFTPFVGLGLSAGLFALARFATPQVAEFVAAFLAVQCSLNALGDISILLTLTTHGEMMNDAGNMAKTYGLPAIFWALLWAVTAIVILCFSLRSYWRATNK